MKKKKQISFKFDENSKTELDEVETIYSLKRIPLKDGREIIIPFHPMEVGARKRRLRDFVCICGKND